MTILAHGDRLDAIEALKELPSVEFLYFGEEQNKDAQAKYAHEMAMAWQALTIPRKQYVFVDPPKGLDPKKLKPRADRHILFTGDVPAAWKRWAESPGVQMTKYGLEPGKLVAFLVAGNAEAGIPKFTRPAAEHLVASNPGGLSALYWPIQALVEAEISQPIAFDAVMDLWPVIPVSGKVYAVKLGDLIRVLGKKDAISLALKVPEKESFGALKGLETACKSNENRVKLISALFKAIDEKRLKPDAALVIFTLACLEETTWPSKSKAGASPSPLPKMLSRLSNIPSSRL